MLLSFANLWQQQELSDVKLVLQAIPAAPIHQEEVGQFPLKPVVLRTLPTHKVLLSASPYFKAQLQAWQQTTGSNSFTTSRTPPLADTHGCDIWCGSCSAPAVTLTLNSAQEELAALAILEAMYGVQPVSQILANSSCTQQLDIALLSDMLDIQGITAPTVNSLLTACQGSSSTAASIVQHLSGNNNIPSCLLPVVKQCFVSYDSHKDMFFVAGVQQILLAVFGDLKHVWAVEGLKALLLDLPLSVMLLLLDMDGLQVTSEDTGHFTAEAYLRHKFRSAAQRDSAQAQLSRLIRCPHLSRFWLTATVASRGPGNQHFLGDLHSHLVELASLRLAGASSSMAGGAAFFCSNGSSNRNGSGDRGGSGSSDREGAVPALLQATEVQQLLQGCPASWLRQARTTKTLPVGVQVQWRLQVSELVKYCKEGFSKASAGQEVPALISNSSSPPLGGLAWRSRVELLADSEDGVLLGLFAGPVDPPANMFYQFGYKLRCQGLSREGGSGFTKDSKGCGKADFLELGPMVPPSSEGGMMLHGQQRGCQLTGRS